MVVGLDVFREAFRDHADQFVLIGGTAASLAMEDAGLEFRATKDLDIVLHVEALTPAFAARFWQFVEDGGYAIRQAAATGKPVFYRFQRPSAKSYPAMLELFARTPDVFRGRTSGHCVPIPFDDAISSLSAILLDDDYYAFVMAGGHDADGLSVIREDRLIPLKAAAWLDLSARQAQGVAIDARDIRKHVNDVLRLSQLLAETTRINAPARVAHDLDQFIARARADRTLDPRSLGLAGSTSDILDRVARAYGLHS